jgi:HSP20 family protein
MLAEPFSRLFELSRGVDRPLPRNGYVGGFLPPADVVITDDVVTVMMDMPGLEVDDFEIELQDDLLRVRGERSLPSGGDRESRVWQRIERGFGKFERALQVPRGLDPDAVEASLEAGVLTLRIAKPEQLRPQRVEIGVSGSGETRQLAGAGAGSAG